MREATVPVALERLQEEQIYSLYVCVEWKRFWDSSVWSVKIAATPSDCGPVSTNIQQTQNAN